MAEKRIIDWEGIEREYRAGILSLREIGAAFGGVTHAAIRKRAERDGWTRDLGAKIKAKAEALVSRDAVSKEVSKASERDIVDANALVIANVDRRHKETARRAQEQIDKLLAELEATDEKLGVRVDILKKLGETFEKFSKFERAAYRLEDVPPPKPAGDETLTPERTNEALRRFAFLLAKAGATEN